MFVKYKIAGYITAAKAEITVAKAAILYALGQWFSNLNFENGFL